MTHSMKRNAPYAVVLVAEELGHFPSPHPCSQRTTTSYAFLHSHLLPSRLNSFEVNGYSGWGDVGKEWNLSHTSSISIKLHGSWKIKGKGLGAKDILGFIEPHFAFPSPGLGHCIHSARLWSKPFQGWNQSCRIWDPQDQSQGLWVSLHHGGMWQLHFMSVSIFMRLEIYHQWDRNRIKPVCLSSFFPSLPRFAFLSSINIY